MSWRSVLLQNKARLSLRHGQLLIERNDDSASIPVEDITVLVLDHHQITTSVALLAALEDAGVAVVICDQRHMPSGLLLPFHRHSRFSEVAALQMGWSQPFRKRAWQVVVRRKIENQAHCLDRAGVEGGDSLRRLVQQVDSGDSENREAQAARYYWQALMGRGFLRLPRGASSSSRVNAALNYGYAILRAAVARALVGRGLLPCFGLHHGNKLNAYNLADDMIEPFRPLADDLVYRMAGLWGDHDGPLTKEDRQGLVQLLGDQLLMEDQVQSLCKAAETAASSLVVALRDKNPKLLTLPRFVM